MKFMVILCVFYMFLDHSESNVSIHVFGYIGQAIEFRCLINDTSKFNRITHRFLNGTTQTLLSNEVFNDEYINSEIHIERYNHLYMIKIDPIKYNSAGLYICEDDVSQLSNIGHTSNITLHVIDYKAPQSIKGRYLAPFWLPLDDHKENITESEEFDD